MLLGGSQADPEHRGGVVVGVAHRDQPQDLGLAPGGQPERAQVGGVQLATEAAEHQGVLERVPVGLDQERPREVDEVALAVVEVHSVRLSATPSTRPEGEGSVNAIWYSTPIGSYTRRYSSSCCSLRGDHVGKAHRAAVQRAHVVTDERVLVGVAGEQAVQRRRDRRVDEPQTVRGRSAGSSCRALQSESTVRRSAMITPTQLVELEQSHHLADQVEDALFEAQRH